MIYRFDSYILDSGEYSISKDDQALSLEPRVFDVLTYLIENRSRIVSKDELIEKLWDGRVISDSALNTCIRSVRRALGDSREQQKYIRTFPKRGFQFVGKLDNEPESAPGTGVSVSISLTSRPGMYWIGGCIAGLILVLAIVLGMLGSSDPDRRLSEKPVIAVLNFQESNSQDTRHYITEGLTEELVASLSKYRELFVIARSSSALFARDEMGVTEIGKELGADYIVDGHIRYDTQQARVSARLIDARTGQQVWSQDFDLEQLELFGFQRDLAYLIAGQVVPELVRSDAEKNSKNPPEVLDAWALYHKARTMQAVYTRDMQDQAILWAEKALVKDPNLAAAHGIIARAKGAKFFFGWGENSDNILEQAIDSAKQAISLDPNDPGAYAALGYIYRYTGDQTSAIANLERATSLNPSDATIKLEYAHTLDWFRHQEQALPEINQAIKLSPGDPRLEQMYFYKAHIQFHLKQFEQSLETTRRMSGVITTDTWRTFYHLVRAANFAQLGHTDQANLEIQAATKINPGLSLTAMRKRFEGSKNHPDNRKFWLDSLEMAGLPE